MKCPKKLIFFAQNENRLYYGVIHFLLALLCCPCFSLFLCILWLGLSRGWHTLGSLELRAPFFPFSSNVCHYPEQWFAVVRGQGIQGQQQVGV